MLEKCFRAVLKRVRVASVAWKLLISFMPSSISTVADDSRVCATAKRSVMPLRPRIVGRAMAARTRHHTPSSAKASRQSVHRR